MNKHIIFIWTCIFILSAGVVLAASATIVTDPTAPGCFGFEDISDKNCNTLKIDGSGAVTYTIPDYNELKPNTDYTVGFLYKVESGTFSFSMVGGDAEGGPFNDLGWTQFSGTFTTGDSSPGTVQLRFSGSGSSPRFYIDELQLTESPEMTKFNNFDYEVGCCPYDFCYTGGADKEHPSCIHDDYYEMNVSMPPLGWNLADFGADSPDDGFAFLDAPSGYRCINGSWKFSRPKFKPFYDGAGFCPDERQCFKGGGYKAEDACAEPGSVHAFPAGDDPDAAYEMFYCHEGNWTTRTKEIALQLLNMANQSDTNSYTIFCDTYERALNPDSTLTFYRDFMGDNIVSILASDITEEFCIMELNGQVIAGVSLNGDINQTVESEEAGCLWTIACAEGGCDPVTNCPIGETPDIVPPKSFIELLRGPDGADYCNAVMEDDDNFDGLYHRCIDDDVFYNPSLRSVLFTIPTTTPKQSVPFNTDVSRSFIGEVWDYLKDLISDLLGFAGLARPASDIVMKDQLSFIQNAGSFDKLYISFSPEPAETPRSIKAIRETRARKTLDGKIEYKTFINAEYLNYPVPICRFFYTHNYDDIRHQISDPDVNQIQCTPVILDEDSWMYSIYVEEPVFEDIADGLEPIRIWSPVTSDNFWNDITAKIRTQAPRTIDGDRPDVPDFETYPDTPVVGAELDFVIPEATEDLIARTWDFGDGEKASSAFNVTTKHMYAGAKVDPGFPVQLCVMNDAYRIRCSERELEVIPGPAASILHEASGLTVDVDIVISGGNTPFNINIDWGDGESEPFEDHDSHELTGLSHTYDSLGSYQINVTGSDHTGETGVNFKSTKVVFVEV